MKINVSEIEIGKKYFAVCIGEIDEITFKKIKIPKAIVCYNESDYEIESSLSDIGVDYPNKSYENDLNFVFKTRQEAEEKIKECSYIIALKEHMQDCNNWDDVDFDNWVYDDYGVYDDYNNEDHPL